MSDSLWKVVYTIDPPIAYTGGPTAFPGSDLTIIAVDGHIARLEHTIRLPAAASESEAQDASRSAVGPFLAAVRYLRIGPVASSIDATRLEPPSGGLIKFGARGSMSVGPRPFAVPTRGWNQQDCDLLETSLTFASEAQETASPATAIRLYYLVIEDLIEQGRLRADAPAVEDLRAVRNFVSHLNADRPWTENRLRACAPELADANGMFRYQPANPVHRSTLDRFRQQARLLVDPLLIARVAP